MKRIKQLHPISKEHHLSLNLGQKALQACRKGDPEEIEQLCQKIVYEYPTMWRVHFQIEEETIFEFFSDRTPEIKALCQQLLQEHQQFDSYYEQMKAGDYSVLEAFGTLLKEHTRTEERQLFPLLEQALSEEELELIYQTSCDYRNQTMGYF